MERVINEIFVITDEEAVSDEIYRITGHIPDMNRVEAHISKLDSTKYYLDNDLNIKNMNDTTINMVWLDTGMKADFEKPVMISLIKRSDYYSGYFVGTPDYLVNGMCRKNSCQERKLRGHLSKFKEQYRLQNAGRLEEEVDTVKNENKYDFEAVYARNDEHIQELTKDVYDNLLFPNWKSIWGLDRYIKIIGTRVSQLVAQNRDEFYVVNNIKSVIVNTGMMNLFGKDFLILYRFYEKYQTYIAESVIQSKQDYLNNGFTKEQSAKELEPINFFDAGTEIFNPIIDDFDINQNCLMHIIQQRKERFPDCIQGQSDARIAGQLISALERGIRMQHRDHSYAKASYSGKSGKVSWFMPLHIESPLCESPELVMAIRRTGDFYEIKTILPYDDNLQDRITALSLYNKVW
ncbi:DUF3825 domain-containing protein [Novisyntrophococcus fermenticellae]|uniref:DUF3825 domain-containing protein n=1 Tax=Novisyntrophococcus fermenticellae TaxID=2068655 RepID=UPI001E4FA756|nr:DUF3825 domain-containing protein [Novisyntrophococcus fermenticellae]